MNFYPIDLKTWPRAQMFYYFSQMAPTGYSITVDMDVTSLLETLQEANRKFFPTYLYLVTKCLNRQQEFKIAYQDKQTVLKMLVGNVGKLLFIVHATVGEALSLPPGW